MRLAIKRTFQILLLTLPAVTMASPGEPELRWHWPTFSFWEWMLTGTAAVTQIVTRAIGPDEQNPTRGTVLLDDRARSALRIDSRQGQRAARDMTDVMLAINTSYPFLVDSLAVAWIYRDSPEVAKQMALINMEVTVLNTALESMAKILVSRQRPFTADCGTEIDPDTKDCYGKGRYTSFFSGHASQTFAAAAATCMHHAYVPLHGGGAAEMVPCATGMAFAAAAGMGRIMGDMHYWSDVMTGALVGTGVGLLVPWLHYREPVREDVLEDGLDGGIGWSVVPYGLGAGVVGTF